MFVSVTRLRVRSVKYLPAFLWQAILSKRQAERSPGFVGGKLLLDAHWTFWTLTVWEQEREMKAFRSSRPHAQVMPQLARWCDEAAYAHWMRTDNSVPGWTEAYEHLVSEGRLSRVSHPSREHDARRFAQPRLSPRMGQDLKPAS